VYKKPKGVPDKVVFLISQLSSCSHVEGVQMSSLYGHVNNSDICGGGGRQHPLSGVHVLLIFSQRERAERLLECRKRTRLFGSD
jgi:hypothetical protein